MSTSEKAFLAIKNWSVYWCRDRNGRPYILDDSDKDGDPDYSRLTMLQRYVLDALYRLRGRRGKNFRNDPVWLVKALFVLPRERRHLPQAIQKLIALGHLLPTDQEGAEEANAVRHVLTSGDRTRREVRG
jgi:hypothetical protein